MNLIRKIVKEVVMVPVNVAKGAYDGLYETVNGEPPPKPEKLAGGK